MDRAQELFSRIVNGGESEILNMIARSDSEELFLDYKRSADNGGGAALHMKDRENLARAISGFGNSEGGVILWGVDCRQDAVRGDVPTGPVPISHPVRFKSWLEGATSGLTIPPHSGVRHHAVVEANNSHSGFVASLIERGSEVPYQTINGLSFYMRSGSNFARVPHAVLAGMFGREPQPQIAPNYVIEPATVRPGGRINSQVGFTVGNFGRGIAKDIYFHITVVSSGGEKCSLAFNNPSETVWIGNFAFGRILQLIPKAEIRLAPEALIAGITMTVKLEPPFNHPFHYHGLCGSSGAAPTRFEVNRSAEEVKLAYEALLASPRSDDHRYTFSKLLCPPFIS